jgi:hypothetical protein
MIVNRRNWLGLLTALGATVGAIRPAAGAKPAPANKQLIHHVFFWLKQPGRKEDLDQLIAGLQSLRPIPYIRELRIGVPAATEARSVVDSSYSVSELMIFDSVEDQKRYQDHPLHLRFVETCGNLWEKVVVYDTIDV